MRNNKLIKGVSMIAIALALTFGFSSCGNKTDSEGTNSGSTKNNQASEKKVQTKSSENESSKDQALDSQKAKTSGGIKFVKEELSDTSSVDFNTPWQKSQNGSYSACIAGRGEEAQEEGQGRIILKQGNGKTYSFTVSGSSKKSPKSIQWIDNDNILVVIGNQSGTVSKGGNLYMLNVKDDNVYLVLDTKDQKKEVMKTSKSGDRLELKVNVYDDDVYNKSHIEYWHIDSFDSTLNSNMKVKDSSGKIIMEI
jgi:hypothetical protein